jgi:hypothetical protein
VIPVWLAEHDLAPKGESNPMAQFYMAQNSEQTEKRKESCNKHFFFFSITFGQAWITYIKIVQNI